jgi:hypothetical protein
MKGAVSVLCEKVFPEMFVIHGVLTRVVSL